MIHFINSFKKVIAILVFIVYCTWGIALITVHAVPFEETSSNECVTEYETKTYLKPNQYTPIALEYFTYEEPKNIEEAEAFISAIKNHIKILQLNQQNGRLGYYTSPAIVNALNEIYSLQTLIEKYENFINEHKVSYTLIDIGEFKLTAYCPCAECSGPWGNMTSTGVIAQTEHTVAVDPKIIPYGTKLLIGDTVYTAQDCGGAVKGNVIDIYFATHAETYEFGVQYSKVYIYQE